MRAFAYLTSRRRLAAARAAVLTGPVLALALPLATAAHGADVIYEQPYEVQRYGAPAPVYAPPPVYVERYVEVSPGYVVPRVAPPPRRAYVDPPPVVVPYDAYGRRYVEIEPLQRTPPPIVAPRPRGFYYPPEWDDIYNVPPPYGWSLGR